MRRRIVQRMMGQPPGRFRGIRSAAAPRGEMLDRIAQHGVFARKAARAAPIDDVDMSIDLPYPRGRLGRSARPIGAEAMESRGRQACGERSFETVPGRRQHRQEARASLLRQPLTRGRQARDRFRFRLGGGKFGFLLSRRRPVAMIRAMHQHARTQVGEKLGRRLERHHGQRKRDGATFR